MFYIYIFQSMKTFTTLYKAQSLKHNRDSGCVIYSYSCCGLEFNKIKDCCDLQAGSNTFPLGMMRREADLGRRKRILYILYLYFYFSATILYAPSHTAVYC